MMTKKTLRAHLLAKTEEAKYNRQQMEKWRDRYVFESQRAVMLDVQITNKDWIIETLEARLEAEIGREAAIGKSVESGLVVLNDETIRLAKEGVILRNEPAYLNDVIRMLARENFKLVDLEQSNSND